VTRWKVVARDGIPAVPQSLCSFYVLAQWHFLGENATELLRLRKEAIVEPLSTADTGLFRAAGNLLRFAQRRSAALTGTNAE
jgi:hypothetical protein